MNQVQFRVYAELNDHLPAERKKVWFDFSFEGVVSISTALAELGIPTEEVDLVLVNHRSEGLTYDLQEGDRISLYPVFERLNIAGVTRVREKALRELRFVCDVHLGRLAKYLRMLGWDCSYSNCATPEEIVARSIAENRIFLSRNALLVRRQGTTHALYVRASDSREQLREVVDQLDLSSDARPLTRCLICNHRLVSAEKQEILYRLQPRTVQYFDRFFRCPACDQLYWEGSHYEEMSRWISKVISNPHP